MLIEAHTKSRARHSNDHAQAESKNGSIVRKHVGYRHSPPRVASRVHACCRDHRNPSLNVHRPCRFADIITDAKGRQRTRDPDTLMMTPYEKLNSLPGAAQCLNPGMTFQQLEVRATVIRDNEAAPRLNNARERLFTTIFNRSNTVA